MIKPDRTAISRSCHWFMDRVGQASQRRRNERVLEHLGFEHEMSRFNDAFEKTKALDGLPVDQDERHGQVSAPNRSLVKTAEGVALTVTDSLLGYSFARTSTYGAASKPEPMVVPGVSTTTNYQLNEKKGTITVLRQTDLPGGSSTLNESFVLRTKTQGVSNRSSTIDYQTNT